MMDKKRVYIRVGVWVAIALIIIHTLTHLIIFGTGIPKLMTTGIATLKIGNSTADLTAFKQSNTKLKGGSSAIFITEWLILIAATVIWYKMRRVQNRKAVNLLMQARKDYKSKTKTDLDVLYDILKEKKQVYISDVAKTFNITEETAMEWGKILEYGNLAEIAYPRMGEPEIVIIDKNDKNK